MGIEWSEQHDDFLKSGEAPSLQSETQTDVIARKDAPLEWEHKHVDPPDQPCLHIEHIDDAVSASSAVMEEHDKQTTSRS